VHSISQIQVSHHICLLNNSYIILKRKRLHRQPFLLFRGMVQVKNKGVISLSIVAGIVVAALIIVLSFSAPESDEIHKDGKNVPVQSDSASY